MRVGIVQNYYPRKQPVDGAAFICRPQHEEAIHVALRSATLDRDHMPVLRRCNPWSTGGEAAWGRDLACALKSTIRISSLADSSTP